MRLLLLSNSTMAGQGWMDHAEAELRDFLGPLRTLVFVPWALADRRGYGARAAERLGRMGLACASLDDAARPVAAVEQAEAVLIGGGNTFRLLDRLWSSGVVPALRRRVASGMPYLGASAGTNVACPTIRTTNDMPIVEPPTFEALGLVPFQINPHYLDAEPGSTHMGETREQRLREFHEDNAAPVVGLREGAWLRREGARLTLGGVRGARVFRRGAEPVEQGPGADLSALLA